MANFELTFSTPYIEFASGVIKPVKLIEIKQQPCGTDIEQATYYYCANRSVPTHQLIVAHASPRIVDCCIVGEYAGQRLYRTTLYPIHGQNYVVQLGVDDEFNPYNAVYSAEYRVDNKITDITNPAHVCGIEKYVQVALLDNISSMYRELKNGTTLVNQVRLLGIDCSTFAAPMYLMMHHKLVVSNIALVGDAIFKHFIEVVQLNSNINGNLKYLARYVKIIDYCGMSKVVASAIVVRVLHEIFGRYIKPIGNAFVFQPIFITLNGGQQITFPPTK